MFTLNITRPVLEKFFDGVLTLPLEQAASDAVGLSTGVLGMPVWFGGLGKHLATSTGFHGAANKMVCEITNGDSKVDPEADFSDLNEPTSIPFPLYVVFDLTVQYSVVFRGIFPSFKAATDAAAQPRWNISTVVKVDKEGEAGFQIYKFER